MFKSLIDPERKRARAKKQLAELRENKAWIDAHMAELNRLKIALDAAPEHSPEQDAARAAYDAVACKTLPEDKQGWFRSMSEIDLRINRLERRLHKLSPKD